MRVFDFTHAIVRTPGHSVVNGLRDDPAAVPNFDGLMREHAAYVGALRDAGVTVDVLEPLEDFPDSVFVEDPALVFPEGAILLNPGAPTRQSETRAMRPVLYRHFKTVLELRGAEHADGGDVLVTPHMVFIGLSKRTSRAGAEALCARLDELGRKARIVETPASILHFKTASSLLSEDTVLATGALAASGVFTGFKVLLVPRGEEGAANALRVNEVVFVGEAYPRTADMIAEAGFTVRCLPVTEVAKLDAGLSCMSLRWHADDANVLRAG